MTVVRVDWQLDELAWADTLARCPDATFFHTVGWLRAVERTWGTRAERACFEFADGAKALLAVSVRPLLGGRLPLAVAGETGAYGGLVATRPLGDAEAEAVFAEAHARYGAWRWVGNPFACGVHLPHPDGLDETHLLTLKSFPELRRGFNRGCKAAGNRARRRGFTLAIKSDSQAVEAFYPLYLDSARRWGDKLTWARPRSFFEALLEEGAPGARIFLAYQGAEPVSGLVMAAHGRFVHYVAGATAESALEDSPSNFLMEAALEHYAERGFEIFDFGASNGLAGVRRFKESFGAQPVPYGRLAENNLPTRLYFTLRGPYERLRALAPAVGRGAPLPRPLPRPLSS